MGRILILDCFGDDWTDKKLSEIDNVDVAAVYHQVCLPLRVIRRLHLYSPLSKKNIWYGSWKQDLYRYDCIIVMTSLLEAGLFSWIRGQGYRGKLIFYYRDSQSMPWIRNECKATAIRATGVDVDLWTFDQNDAREFGIKYNPQFFFDDVDTSDCVEEYDAVYIGSVHKRLDEIYSIWNVLKDKGFKLHFLLRTEKQLVKEKIDGIKYTYRGIGYDDILAINRRSRCIIEIMNKGQHGLTLRALEALFQKRKLITDNLAIKQYDFYNPNNIFIWGYDDVRLVKEWMLIPFQETSQDITDKYTAESWLKRFLQ